MFIIPLFVWLSGKMFGEMPEANNELLLHNRFEKTQYQNQNHG